MNITMTDLTVQYGSIKEEIDLAVRRVMESGRFVLGSEVEALEADMAKYIGVKHGIGVASGTDALVISLLACGVKPGDEVITTPFTFAATAQSVVHCGASPVFVDIEPRTYNINPEQIERKISSKTRAIIPVHLFGQSVEMDIILELARKHNLKIIEDCAQAASAEYNGKKVGSIGDTGCFSFFPSKNLGAYGDGGMILTNDAKIAENARILRQHGQTTAYCHVQIGYNSRLDAIQAAILRAKLKHLDAWSSTRRQKASLYSRMLSQVDGIEPPYIASHNLSSVNYYTVRLGRRYSDRDALRKYLSENGVDTGVYYPLSLHLQEAYKNLGYVQGDFPESERAQEQVLSLPMFPEISEESINEIVNKIKDFSG